MRESTIHCNNVINNIIKHCQAERNAKRQDSEFSMSQDTAQFALINIPSIAQSKHMYRSAVL